MTDNDNDYRTLAAFLLFGATVALSFCAVTAWGAHERALTERACIEARGHMVHGACHFGGER